MSRDVTVCVVEDVALEDLGRVGLHPAGRLPVAEARRAPGLYGLDDDRRTILIGTDPDLVTVGEALAAQMSTRVVTAMLQHSTQTYLFQVEDLRSRASSSDLEETDPGADWELTRTLMVVAGKVVSDHGEPLPEETSDEILDEHSTAALLERVTGLRLEDLDEREVVRLSAVASPDDEDLTDQTTPPPLS